VVLGLLDTAESEIPPQLGYGLGLSASPKGPAQGGQQTGGVAWRAQQVGGLHQPLELELVGRGPRSTRTLWGAPSLDRLSGAASDEGGQLLRDGDQLRRQFVARHDSRSPNQ
jgi:hypothetical protein